MKVNTAFSLTRFLVGAFSLGVSAIQVSSSPSSYVQSAAAGVAWWREGAATTELHEGGGGTVHEPTQARARGERLL
jgi:hypothetical protein